MRKFKFSLETMLKVKEAKKKEAEVELFLSRERVEKQQKILDRIKNERKLMSKKIESTTIEGIKAIEARQLVHYYSTVCKRMKHQQARLERTLKEYKAVEEKMVELIKEIKVLEKLKEKQYRDYCFQMAKEEEKRVAEIVNYKSSQQ